MKYSFQLKGFVITLLCCFVRPFRAPVQLGLRRNVVSLSHAQSASSTGSEFDVALASQIVKVGRGNLPMGVADVLIMQTLRSAAKRDRLDGNTFRLLSLGFVGDAFQNLLTHGPMLVSSGEGLSPLFILRSFADIYVASTCFPIVTKNWPELDHLAIQKGNLLTVLYFVALLGFLGRVFAGGSPLLVALTLTLNGAAQAGDERLSSQTYRYLNTALVMTSGIMLVRLLKAVALRGRGFGLLSGVTLLTTGSAVMGGLWGLARGLFYRHK